MRSSFCRALCTLKCPPDVKLVRLEASFGFGIQFLQNETANTEKNPRDQMHIAQLIGIMRYSTVYKKNYQLKNYKVVFLLWKLFLKYGCLLLHKCTVENIVYGSVRLQTFYGTCCSCQWCKHLMSILRVLTARDLQYFSRDEKEVNYYQIGKC